MRTIIGAAIALSTLLSAGAAEAQTTPKTFYMRHVIKGVRTAAGTTTPTAPTSPTTPSPAPSYTYTPTYSGYGTCSNGTRYSNMIACTRSDGQNADRSLCVSAGYQTTLSQSCTPPVTYTLHDHGYGECTNGQRPHYYDCLGSNGSDGNFVTMCSSTITNNPVYESC
jgi:hypothetical protein